MSDKKRPNDPLRERAKVLARDVASLASEAAADPALRGQLDAALQALGQSATVPRNAAVLDNPGEARALVRDVIAEELERYWQRRFGRKP